MPEDVYPLLGRIRIRLVYPASRFRPRLADQGVETRRRRGAGQRCDFTRPVRSLGQQCRSSNQATPELVRELARLNETSLEVLVALGEIGPAASNAIPALKNLTGLGYRPVASAAAVAMNRITHSPPSR